MAKFRLIFALCTLLPLTVGAQSTLYFDKDFIDLLIEESSTVEDALHNVDRVCRQENNELINAFNQERRAAGRNLDSVEDGGGRRKVVNKSLAKLNKNLDQIKAECERARKIIVKRFPIQHPVAVQQAIKKPTAKKLAPKPSSAQKKPMPPPATTAKSDIFKIHGSLKNEVAYRIDKPHEFTKNRYQMLLKESLILNERFKVRSTQRAFFDSVVYDFNNDIPVGSTTTEKNDLESELALRELYLDGSFGNVDVRIGKQQIVWGESLALFVADIVNGKDLREYILPEFDWMRLPQWSVDIISSKNAFTTEAMVSIPEFNKLGTRGSEFAFPFEDPGVPYVLNGTDEPEKSLANADWGGRLGYLVGGLDLGMFFLHTWNKFPVFERRMVLGTLHITPTYERMDILGGTFSKDAGESIVKGEMTIRPNQPYSTDDPLDADGVEKKMTLDYVLGIDRTYFDEVETNFQIFQTIKESAPVLTHFSVWMKTDLFDKRVSPEIQAIISANKKDHLYRPKIVFKVSDAVLFNTGVDIFDGKAGEGLFGIFDRKSRAFFEIEYHF